MTSWAQVQEISSRISWGKKGITGMEKCDRSMLKMSVRLHSLGGGGGVMWCVTCKVVWGMVLVFLGA